jgi:GMP synthase (glutamine-hydrolysing)
LVRIYVYGRGGGRGVKPRSRAPTVIAISIEKHVPDMQVVVVNASSDPLRTRENFTRVVDAPVTVVDAPRAQEHEYPTEDVAGIVISGSEASVLDNESWMQRLATYLRKMDDADVPMLGICWGHQFLAQLFGGKVERLPAREIGLQTVEVVDESVVLLDFEDVQTVFETHEDGVVVVPPGASVTAKNDVGIQSFAYDDRVFGVQFHPEFERDDMVRVFEKYLDGERATTELAKVTVGEVEKFSRTATVFDRFIRDVCSTNE